MIALKDLIKKVDKLYCLIKEKINNTWGGITGNIENQADLIAYIQEHGGTGSGVFTSDITVSLQNNKTLGKYVNGQTIPSNGKTFQEVLEDIANEYVIPTITNFTIVGQAVSVELGTILSGNKNFSFNLTNISNITANTLYITDVTNNNNLLVNSSVVSPKTVNIGTISKTTPSTHQWRASIKDTNNVERFSNLFTVNFVLSRFFGPSSTVLNTSTQVRSTLTPLLDNTSNTFNLQTGDTQTIFNVFIPSSKSISTVIDTTALNADITSSYVLIDNNFQLADAGGTLRSYKKYQMTIAVPYSANHTHQITLI